MSAYLKRDTYSNKRFLLSLLLSLILHSIVFFGLYFLYDYIKHKTPKLHKINAENLLVLKRGRSLDPSANTPGAKKPSLAKPNTSQTIPTPPLATQSQPKENPPTKPTPQSSGKTPLPSQSLPNTSQNTQIDHKNLKFFTPNNQQYAQAQNIQKDKGMDPQTIRDIDELYGDEWGDLGDAQKDFVTSNLREIARITQSYLEYPQTAGYLRQSGENAIEFYLLPNGDIEDLKLIKNSGFVLLDKNSLKTIEIAFKDYPRPHQKTLIRFHITYRLIYR
ncbi:energy transducer TonB [Helicobacter fennelliae]|uniref:Ferric siderophore transport system, periplasmic binding protein TonB n=1 Tax=Helicobacter fennelliae TaxID=215 RepID=A0A2X3B598_9HELI|nr:TonB family protein [Helicobacter fennelliae]SQB98982.1 ferric siderophore transport system, periplasmic binding protein TonB [Helicobacter fennelliae]STQ84674.1 ferric siderophore transport system, periplasmic binding protein TonB [Helicobacter fennelliae]